MFFKNIAINSLLMLLAGTAHASVLLDFKLDAGSNEQGYISLNNYAGLKITASATTDDDRVQYAFMDEQWRGLPNTPNGGLGVCKDLAADQKHCNPGSDDNDI